jgi:hypothetical protein
MTFPLGLASWIDRALTTSARPAWLCFIVLLAASCAQRETDKTRASDDSAGSNRQVPVFLSDTDEAYRYLEEIQRQAYEQNPHLLIWHGKTPEQLTELQKTLPLLAGSTRQPVEYFRKMLSKPLPTRYEDPLLYDILKTLVDEIMSIPRKADASTSDAPFPRFGTLPIQSVNAESIQIPASDQRIIVVNKELFFFCFEMTKLALETVEIKRAADGTLSVNLSQAACIKRINDNPYLFKRMCALLFEFSGNVGALQHDNARPEYGDLPVAITHGMELFALSHEYAHIIIKHEPVERDAWNVADSGGGRVVNVSVLRRSWTQESEADSVGFLLMMAALDRHRNERRSEGGSGLYGAAVTAPFLYFQFSEIAEEANSIYTDGKAREMPTDDELDEVLNDSKERKGESAAIKGIEAKYKGHPPNRLRASTVHLTGQLVHKVPPEDFTQEELDLYRLGLVLPRNIKLLWISVKPLYTRLAPKWKEEERKLRAGGRKR